MNSDISGYLFDSLESAPDRTFVPLNKSTQSITADIGHRCPHLDAYLPKFLDTQGLGLFSDAMGSNVLPHPTKKIRRSSISSLHLSSVLNPIYYIPVSDDRMNDSNKINTTKIVRHMFGKQEKNLDLHVSGLLGSTPLLSGTFMDQVLNERKFEVKALKYYDGNKLTGRNHSDDSRTFHVADDMDEFDDKIEIQNQILSLQQTRANQFFPIPSKVGYDSSHELQALDVRDAQKCRDIDLKLANARIEGWLDIIRQNRDRYWSNTLIKSCSISCKRCPKRNTQVDTEASDDELLQCLDCGLIACGVEFRTGIYSKRHMQRHFLRQNHSLAISCGRQGKVFCMKCGDFVYNEVLDLEMERIEIGYHLPQFKWERNLPLQRSFCIGNTDEDFIAVPSDSDDSQMKVQNKIYDQSIVWRGLRASYQLEVPKKFIQAARSTLQRKNLFRGNVQSFYSSNFSNVSSTLRFVELQRKRKSYKNFFDQPVGIMNSGNSCYMTSVLQCLFHSNPVQNYFLRDVRHNSESCRCLRNMDIDTKTVDSQSTSSKLCLTCAFDETILNYYARCLGIDFGEVFPSNLMIPMKNLPPIEPGTPLVISNFLIEAWKSDQMRHLAGHDQHDAHEFLQALLDVLDKECARMEYTIFAAKKKSCYSKFRITENEKNQECSTITSSFKGTLKSVLVCNECRCKKSQYESFVNISLPIIKRDNDLSAQTTQPLNILQCLDNFTAAECLTDPVHCDWCRNNTKMMKQQTIAELPTILCFHLKRFDSTSNKKIDLPISFPSCLNMGGYLPHWSEVEQVTPAEDNEINVLGPNTEPHYFYDLYATINHSGNLNQGHYEANVQVNEKWYCCNDSHVRLLSSEDDVLNNIDAYIIFYVRRKG